MYPISTPVSSQVPASSSRKPRPTAPSVYGHGYYVGVRINKYETKAQARARGQGNTGMIHPAVILAGPDVNNRYDIATISTEHPDCPPRAPLSVFHPTTTVTGDVSYYQRNVAHSDLRPWIDEHTGNISQPMSQSQLARLRSQMIVQPPQPPANGAFFPVASNVMGNRPWSEESVYPKPVGQPYTAHSNFPYPANHQNVHLSPFPPSNGQFYTPPISQGTPYGYAAPYNIDPYRGAHPTPSAMGRPPTYPARDSTLHHSHPSNSMKRTCEWR